MLPLAEVEEIWLRAWVNEGIITAEQFEAEMRRRKESAAREQSMNATNEGAKARSI